MLLAESADRTRRSFIDRIGIYPPLAWGFAGLLLFMIGDGVESGFLSLYLGLRGIPQKDVALIFTVYGVTAAIAAWLSGALSDLWGPRQVMAAGLTIWVVFEVAFLLFGIAPANYPLILLLYALRGFGYPLFAYGFLVWVTVATPPGRQGTAVGWFWFAFTGGLPTLGSLFASYSLPLIGYYPTLWCSLGLVLLGGAVALLGVQEPTGKRRLAPPDENPLVTLLSSVTIAWKKPKTAVGCIVRVINTAPQFGFLVFLPTLFHQDDRLQPHRMAPPPEPDLPEQHHLESLVRDHRRQARLEADGGLLRRIRFRRHHPAALLRPSLARTEFPTRRPGGYPVRRDPGGLRATFGPDAGTRA